MPTPVGFDPSTYSSASPSAFTLGGEYTYRGQLYQFVKIVTADGADGFVYVRSGASVGLVIGANRGGVTGAVTGVGVGVLLQASTCYGFILKRGTHTNLLVNVATAGQNLSAAATNDSGTNTAAATAPVFGRALTTAAGVGRITAEIAV